PAVRAGAVLAAVQSGRRWPGKRAVEAVRAAWRDGDPFAAGDGDQWQPTVFLLEALEDLLDRLAPADRAPIVAALLDSPDPQVRKRAAMQASTAIGESRSVREPLTDVLIPALTDADPHVRLAAADAIRRAGPLGAHAADALAAVVDRYDDEAAGQALAALVELGDPRAAQRLPEWIRSGTAADDIGAALIEAGTPITAELLDAVRFRLGALFVEQPRQRHIDVLRSVPGRGQYGDSECTTLLMLVQSWGPAAAPAVEQLVELLRADRLAERVINTLAAIGPGAAAALPALRAHADKVRRNRDRDQELLAVARACWRLTRDPEPAIDEAWRGVKRGNIGGDPIALLDEIGDPVRRLLPAIQAALPTWMANCEWYHSDRLALTRMVWQWTGDPTPALSYSHVFLGLDMGGYGRIEAAILAGELGDTTSVAALIQVASEHGSYAQRVRACRALWRLTGDPNPGLSALLKSMTTADYAPTKGSWAPVLDLLAELGPIAAPFVPQLKRLAERDATVARPGGAENPGHTDEQTRAAIRATIKKIDDATREIDT
ncbi:HEAT repeat domain-containing protein, partial [Allorhizocola rhizosphaerae]|uniref:HEAT repeat domain-containing protein n=1 Tax=Allorhizocola rhizosphaerae TaxID=1872709 RepID=UPI0013C324C8